MPQCDTLGMGCMQRRPCITQGVAQAVPPHSLVPLRVLGGGWGLAPSPQPRPSPGRVGRPQVRNQVLAHWRADVTRYLTMYEVGQMFQSRYRQVVAVAYKFLTQVRRPGGCWSGSAVDAPSFPPPRNNTPLALCRPLPACSTVTSTLGWRPPSCSAAPGRSPGLWWSSEQGWRVSDGAASSGRAPSKLTCAPAKQTLTRNPPTPCVSAHGTNLGVAPAPGCAGAWHMGCAGGLLPSKHP
jgi:hypothetical protein